MPCPSHRPYEPDMNIIRPHSMPRGWWLCPWAYAKQLHRNCIALKALCDRQDDLLQHKVSPRPRWSIWIAGKPGPDRKYMFVDNDKQETTSPNGITYGTAVHFHGDTWTIMKDPEDAIVFCDKLNRGEIK